MKTSYKCSTCGYFNPDRQGLHEICPVCFWQDDSSSYHEGGPNGMTMKEAKKNYKKYGAAREEFAKYVRKPYVEEVDESKSGIARLKRLLVYEMSKFDNSNTKSAEMMADRILNSEGDVLVLQIRQMLAESKLGA